MEMEIVFFKSCKPWEDKCGITYVIMNWLRNNWYIILGLAGIVIALGIYCGYYRNTIKKLGTNIYPGSAGNKESELVIPSQKWNILPQFADESSQNQTVKNFMKTHLRYDDTHQASDLVDKYDQRDWTQFCQDHQKSLKDYFEGKKQAAQTYYEIKRTERLLQQRSLFRRILPKLLTGRREFIKFKEIPRINYEKKEMFNSKVDWFVVSNLGERGETRALKQWLADSNADSQLREKFIQKYRTILKKYINGKLSNDEAWNQIALKEYQGSQNSNLPNADLYLQVNNPKDFTMITKSPQSQIYKDHLAKHDPRLKQLKFVIAELLRNDNEKVAYSAWLDYDDENLQDFYKHHKGPIDKYWSAGKTIDEVWPEIKNKEYKYWENSMTGKAEYNRPILKLKPMQSNSLKTWNGQRYRESMDDF